MDGRDSAGGSRVLAGLIDEYGEVLLPDLKHYFGIDLRDLFSEENPLSPRYVLVHIKWLGMDSAYIAERRGGQRFRGWDEGRYTSVAIVNALRAFMHMYLLSHIDPKKSKPKAPEPFPIPDRKSPQAHKPGSFANLALAKLTAAKRRKNGGG